MEISIEFPDDQIDPDHAAVSVSPTHDEDGVMTDYDWNDVTLPYNDIAELIELAVAAEKN